MSRGRDGCGGVGAFSRGWTRAFSLERMSRGRDGCGSVGAFSRGWTCAFSNESPVHVFERSVEACKRLFESLRAAPNLREIPVAELVSQCDDGGAHGAVFVSALRPRQTRIAVDPECESHRNQ